MVVGKIVANEESLISGLDGSGLVLLQVVISWMVEVAVSISFIVRLIMRKRQGRK